jgi:ATP-dependent exoDNAse (exonuclease V) beta subunit
VWWDPAVLELDRDEDVGLRQQKILQADEAGVARAGEEAHARWQAARADALARGAAPSLRVAAVTALAAAGAAAAGEVEVARARGPRPARPGGARFGALVHAVLAAVDLDASPPALRAAAALHGREVGAPAAEIEAAVTSVEAALAHPLLRRAAAAAARGACRREAPVLLRLPDGSLAEGVLDLAFREEGALGWTVVDFKTDRELAVQRAAYAAQVRLYAEALARATGEPARAVLLVV